MRCLFWYLGYLLEIYEDLKRQRSALTDPDHMKIFTKSYCNLNKLYMQLRAEKWSTVLVTGLKIFYTKTCDIAPLIIGAAILMKLVGLW